MRPFTSGLQVEPGLRETHGVTPCCPPSAHSSPPFSSRNAAGAASSRAEPVARSRTAVMDWARSVVNLICCVETRTARMAPTARMALTWRADRIDARERSLTCQIERT
jgi:hypothetical protein